MTTELKMVDGVRQLTVASVQKYLQETGWTKSVSINPRAIPYRGQPDSQGNSIVVVMPSSKTLIDADRRMNDVIRTVAALESRSPESLVETISQLGVRRASAGVTRGKSLSRTRTRKTANATA